MSNRSAARPLSSYLLRVHEEQIVRVVRRYELLNLANGELLRFSSLTALQRHLRRAEADLAAPGTAARPAR